MGAGKAYSVGSTGGGSSGQDLTHMSRGDVTCTGPPGYELYYMRGVISIKT